jgi:hypothetical protein
MRILCGCGASFLRSGIRIHQQRSSDPRCNAPLHTPAYEPEVTADPDGEVGEESNLDAAMDNTDMMDDFEVDPRGDFFGDYRDYSAEEFGLQPEEDEADGNNSDEEDREDVDESSLEPERFPPTFSSSSDDVEASGNETQPAMRLRGGAEVKLKNKPYAVRFTKGKAGATFTNHDYTDENTLYTSQMGNPDNPFSPFSSKLEWEIAHWAKTRGPSSTAFTELISIEGVRGINALDLNLTPPPNSRSTNVLASPSRTCQS